MMMTSDEEDVLVLRCLEDTHETLRRYEEEGDSKQQRAQDVEYAAALDHDLAVHAHDAEAMSGVVDYSALLGGLRDAGVDAHPPPVASADDDDLAAVFDGDIQMGAMYLMEGGGQVSGSPQ